MTRFWCPWCGETAIGERREDRISCMRCLAEFTQLFGFAPETAMVPLKETEIPGVPEATTKRFVFRTPAGEEIGRTWSPSGVDARAS